MTNELKWCRCDEPNFMKLPSSINMLNPFCLTCGNEWRKWKNIRGTELLDYPIGTEVSLIAQDLPEGFIMRTARDHQGGIILEWCSLSTDWTELHTDEYGYYLFQDRFEIVESESE